jgi:hypothetical protein
MSGATLTDQVGAMTFVDEIRHRKMAVDEHLDLPKRRQDVGNKIREYYVANNIPVSDEIIDDGVRRYFDGRLVFEAPDLERIPAFFAKLFITRDRWLLKFALFVGAIFFSILSINAIYSFYQNSVIENAQLSLDQTKQAANGISVNLHDLQARYDILGGSLKNAPLLSASRILSDVPKILSSVKQMGAIALPAKVTQENKNDLTVRVAHSNELIYKANVSLAGAKTTLAAVESLIATNARYIQLISSKDFSESKNAIAAVDVAEADARMAIDHADIKGVPAAVNSVASLERMVADVPKAMSLISELNSLKSQFNLLGLTTEEMLQVSTIADRGTGINSQFDLNALTNTIKSLSELLHYAKTPLKINVVDRAGVKSGVERNYSDGNGKSWYLIVQANDPDGNVMPVDTVNIESGVRVPAAMFGVRVPHDLYEKVKSQKKATGHVEDHLLGSKKSNSITIQYAENLEKNPDTITQW